MIKKVFVQQNVELFDCFCVLFNSLEKLHTHISERGGPKSLTNRNLHPGGEFDHLVLHFLIPQ